MPRSLVLIALLLTMSCLMAVEASAAPRSETGVLMRALSISGNNTPTVNLPQVYIVRVINEGSRDCFAFRVAIRKTNQTIYGVSESYALAAGAVMEVPVPCLFSEVITTNTVQPAIYVEDITDPVVTQGVSLRVDPVAASQNFCAYSDDDAFSYSPLDMRYNSNLFQCIILEREIRQTGLITALRVFTYFGYSNVTRSIKIWLGHTSQSELTDGFINPFLMSLVYDGVVSIPNGFGRMGVTLQTPFQYQGGNLVMLIQRPWDYEQNMNSNQFMGRENAGIRNRHAYSNTVALNPYDPPQSSLAGGFVPLTSFGFSASAPQAECLITPGVVDFGKLPQDSRRAESLAVMNGGQTPLIISDIQLLGSACFALAAVPVLPITLLPSQRIELSVILNGEGPGNKQGVIRLLDPGGLVLNSSSIQALLQSSQHSLPFFEDFSGLRDNLLPHGWDSVNTSNAPSATTGSTQNQGHLAPGATLMFNSADGSAPLWLVAPKLANPLNAGRLRIKCWAKAFWPVTLQLGLMPDSLSSSGFSALTSYQLSTDWALYHADIDAPAEGVRIAFKHGGQVSSVYIWLDDISIESVPIRDLAIQGLSGPAQPLQGALARHLIEIKNWGAGVESDYRLSLMDQDENVLWQGGGPALAPLETQGVEASWYPVTTSAMTLKARVSMRGDEAAWNNLSQPFGLDVVSAEQAYLVLGENRRQEKLPLNFNSNNSLYEVIIPHQQMQDFYGQITGLSLYGSFVNPMNNKRIKLWMGTTGRDDLSAGWIPSSQLEPVYDGLISIAPGPQTLSISFDQPFDYRDGRNLVIMFNRAWDVLSYGANNRFQSWNIPPGKALGISSSTLTIDPALPIEGSPLDYCPLIRFELQYGGVGHLSGRVLDDYNQPVDNALVSIDGTQYETLSNLDGNFSLQNLLSGFTQISISKHGYRPFNWSVEIPDGGTLASEYRLSSFPLLNIQGRILASDTQSPLSNARIRIYGYDEAETLSGPDGTFILAGVWGEHSYSFSITASGYAPLNGGWNLDVQNLLLGDIVLNELAWPAHTVIAVADDQDASVSVTWQPPSEQASDITEDFETESFPPPLWEQVITNADPPGSSGILPTWSSFGAVSIDGSIVNPPSGNRQAGLWWSFNHQDEWLITPLFNCPLEAQLSFETWCRYGSNAGDSYSVKLTNDGGQNWITLWDASDQPSGWNQYQNPVQIDLSPWGGSAVKLAWHASDPPSNDGLWYVWFIDAVSVSNASTTLRFFTETSTRRMATSSQVRSANPLCSSGQASKQTREKAPGSGGRHHTGYRVARGFRAAESSVETWTELAELPLSQTFYTDAGWGSLADGIYRWSVSAIYSNGVIASPAISNAILRHNITGSLAGIVRSAGHAPIMGALIQAGPYQTSSNSAGAYNLVLPIGVYEVTASAPGYNSAIKTDILISENLVSTLNFYLEPGSDTDDPSAPALRTAIHGIYPNPVKGSCRLELELAKSSRVKLCIYDIRGRRIATLQDEQLPAGFYQLNWKAVDSNGRALPSGVYILRMETGSEVFTRKLMLLK